MMVKVKAVICPCDGRKPHISNISTSPDNLIRTLEGCPAVIRLPYGASSPNVVTLVNPYGKRLGLEANHCFGLTPVNGPAVILAKDGEGLGGLSDDTARMVLNSVMYEWSLYYQKTPGKFPTK